MRESEPPPTLIASHLAREARELCDSCLADSLGIPLLEVIQATLRLEGLPGFRVRYHWCSQCRRRDRVISADLSGRAPVGPPRRARAYPPLPYGEGA